jgi:RNA ligase (TIGR02306 family)
MSSEHNCAVVQLGQMLPHPNADTLDITMVHGGYPCIVKKGSLIEGDLAIYIPVDNLLPLAGPFTFLERLKQGKDYIGDGVIRHRLKSIRLRGTFSMGLLLPLSEIDSSLKVGEDVTDLLEIIKYEPPEPTGMGEDEKDPGFLPCYDIEGLRRWQHLLVNGEQVVITEKIHGENARFAWQDGRLWCASRTRFKKFDSHTSWTNVARRLELSDRFANAANGDLNYPYAIYGEVYGGGAQALSYGVQRGQRDLAIFDILEIKTRRWLNYDQVCEVANNLGLNTVPLLFGGKWEGIETHKSLAEGSTTIGGVTHLREGFVVKPIKERISQEIGRVILKLHGEGWLTS